MNYRIKWLSSVCYAPMMLALVTSCAEGVDDNERFSAGVSNTQLESPELDPNTFKTQINADGSESVEVTWPVVFGAGGYLANVQDVTNPANPVAIVKDSVIDGCRFSFPRLVDTKYEVSVSTLGNEKLNNTASATPTVVAFSTFLPATIIPEGMEISQFIAENLQASTDEVAFELIAGKTYQLSGEADFDLTPITLRGDKYNRPLVVVSGKEGCLVTQAGLKIKHIDFDMSSAEATSFIKLSANPSESISTEALGFKALGANQNSYVIMGQVAVESCNFRNMPGSFIWGNKKPYSLNDFRITDCVVQLNNASSATFINFADAGTGCIKSLTLKNSTFYNLLENNSAYFLRYSHPSNADPQKIFGTGATALHTLDHCTFDRTFSGKDFANNMTTVDRFNVVMKGNIFYDVFRLYQYIRSNNVKVTTENNVIWGNYNDNVSNANDLKYADKVDPNFVGPTLQEFNLDDAKGGVNFRPQNATCVDNKIGDPRWFE